MKQPVFQGLCTALVTPFKNGTIDKPKLEQLIDMQVDGGASAIVVCGTTGEASTLSTQEQIEIIAHCVKYTAGRIKVLAGTGSNDTAHSIEMSRVACSLGVDGLLIVTPYYNKTTQAGLVEHYIRIADQVTSPIIVYNVPSRTGMSININTYTILSEHPMLNGTKEASGDLGLIQRILDKCGERFHVWAGNDDQIVPVMSVGGAGIISVLGNILPSETSHLLELCKLQNYNTAGREQCRLMPLIDHLFSEVNPIPVKAAMNILGYDVGLPRHPLMDMSPEGKKQMKKLLEQFGVTYIS